jgi:hypothetical protein
LIYGKTTGFCMLIVCSATLLTVFIISKSLWWNLWSFLSIESYHLQRRKIWLLPFLCVSLFFLLVWLLYLIFQVVC